MQIDDISQALGRFPAATIYEAVGKAGAVLPAIRPMLHRSRMSGRAFTVRILPGETRAVLTAIDEAPAGSVLVIDCGDTGVSAVWGGTSSLAAAVRGLAGCVTNGWVRDLEEMQEIGFPVYACGTTVNGTLKNHPGWKNLPVALGGVVVHPGDYVVGDADGVVVVPRALGQDAVEASHAQREKEEARDARIKAGEALSDILGLR